LMSPPAIELLSKATTLGAVLLAVTDCAPWWSVPLPFVALFGVITVVGFVHAWRELRGRAEKKCTDES
jgi:membrane protein YdbS with pleckstrin-like domain